MSAIIKTGGKQYLVNEKDEIFVELLDAKEGSKVTFDEVLQLDDTIGTPTVKGATVEGKIVKHGKGKKVVIFKFTAKKDFRKKKGHRQPYTKVQITSIKKG